MKDSGIEWIGMIPSSWKNKTLRHLLIDRVGGAWGNEPANENERTVCLRIADFDFDKGLFKECALDELTYRTYTRKQIKKLALREGDILIEKSGGGEKTPVGRAVYYDGSYGAVLYANFMERLRFKSDEINSKFVEYWLRTWYFCRCSPFYINQTIGIQNIDLTLMLAKEQIFFPLLQDQYKIADFLDQKCSEIDALTADIQTQIETLEEYKNSVITEAVTKGLDPNVEMKDSGVEWIGMIPSSWKNKTLRHLLIDRVGGAWGNEPANENERTVCLRIADFDFDKGLFKECALDELTYRTYTRKQIKKLALREGDILIEKSGGGEKTPVGRAVYYDGSYGAVLYANFMERLRFKSDEINSKFVEYWLRTWYFCRCSPFYINQTIGIQNIDLTLMLAKEQIFFPLLQDQYKIADFLDQKCSEIDLTISEKQQQLETLAEYKKSLIYEYVTGKKEVA